MPLRCTWRAARSGRAGGRETESHRAKGHGQSVAFSRTLPSPRLPLSQMGSAAQRQHFINVEINFIPPDSRREAQMAGAFCIAPGQKKGASSPSAYGFGDDFDPETLSLDDINRMLTLFQRHRGKSFKKFNFVAAPMQPCQADTVQHLCHRVPSMPRPSFLTVPQGGMPAPASGRRSYADVRAYKHGAEH